MYLSFRRGLISALPFSAGLIGSLSATAVYAAPVVFLYDSGTFTSGAYAGSPMFGTHFTASLTYSNDFDYTIMGQQYLNSVATLTDWSVTSGDYTLNSTNATINPNISVYFSPSTGVPLLTIEFTATANPGLDLSITGRPGLNIVQGLGVNPAIRCGLYNQVCGTNYRSFNVSNGSYTKGYLPVGSGGSDGSGSGSSGTTSGGAAGSGGSGTMGGAIGAVPEPASWSMVIVGFGFLGAAMRRAGMVHARRSYVRV